VAVIAHLAGLPNNIRPSPFGHRRDVANLIDVDRRIEAQRISVAVNRIAGGQSEASDHDLHGLIVGNRRRELQIQIVFDPQIVAGGGA